MKLQNSILLVTFFLFSQVSVKAQMIVEPFVAGVNRVTAITNSGDDRIFIVEQAGRIRISDLQGNLLPDTFMNIVSRVRSTGGEQGLLGIAFSPNYITDGRFYLNYTNLTGNTVISRFKVSDQDPNQADSSSEEILITIPQPYSNHNGGDLHFGNDGYLYIATGDGGSAGDPGNRAQNLQDLLGKILRIDVSGATGYSIPDSNPFVTNPNAAPEIWSYGWRNPWRFSFDTPTGDMWIADVGQSLWEEVNFEPAGSVGGGNYGWRCYEGSNPFNLTGCLPPNNYVMPVHEFPHGPDCSVTGGFVYRGALSNEWFGKYFFTDYCSGNIRSLAAADTGGFTMLSYGVFDPFVYTTFGQDRYGELYIGKNSTGVFKIRNSQCKPVASAALTDTVVTSAGSYLLSTPFHPELSYSWFFNGELLQGETNSTLLANVTGDYNVLVMKNDSCFTLSKTATVILGQKSGFEIYPNPSTSEVNIVWSLNFPGMKYLEVFDVNGRLIESTKINSQVLGTKLDVSHYSHGIYFLRIVYEGTAFTGKLLVK